MAFEDFEDRNTLRRDWIVQRDRFQRRSLQRCMERDEGMRQDFFTMSFYSYNHRSPTRVGFPQSHQKHCTMTVAMAKLTFLSSLERLGFPCDPSTNGVFPLSQSSLSQPHLSHSVTSWPYSISFPLPFASKSLPATTLHSASHHSALCQPPLCTLPCCGNCSRCHM